METIWIPIIGDSVAYASHHPPGPQPRKLNATGTITRLAFGPPGHKILEIDGKCLRLQTEVKLA